MTMGASLLPEFDQEMAFTRALLGRVPEKDASWKPHPKSMGLGQLAAHLANLPTWATATIRQTEFDLEPPGGAPYAPPGFGSTKANLANFDKNVAEARALIGNASEADLVVPWSLKKSGQTIFALPRIAVLRTFVMNHIIHHRGQLSVFLRLKDVALPMMYGPTADTTMGA